MNTEKIPQPQQEAAPALPELPEFSYFLENSTHEMQKDAIRAYAKAYARTALSQPHASVTTIANLRHVYANLMNEGVRNFADAKRIATGLLGPAIEALEASAQEAAPVTDEREAFEAWAKSRPWVEFSDYAWQAWQARATAAVQAAPTEPDERTHSDYAGARTGEILGHGLPDWPDDLHSFKERKAYQRGVADCRVADKAAEPRDVIDALREILGVAGSKA